ncbi:hypothetical protein PG990_000167 [Apiospora arundinis]
MGSTDISDNFVSAPSTEMPEDAMPPPTTEIDKDVEPLATTEMEEDATILPVELEIPILLLQASATNPRIHWGPWFHSHLPDPLQRAINSDTLSDAAIDVIYQNYAFVVKAEPHNPGTMASAPRFLETIVPAQGLAAMTSLAMEVEFNDADWPRVIRSVGPKLKSLRSLTIVARYEVDNTIYNFNSTAVLNQLCKVVDEAVWPMGALGHKFDQLIVHIHSGAGSWLAGRDTRMEPVFFFERADVNPNKSIVALINRSNNGIVRETPRKGFVEGIVPASLVENIVEGRFRW